MRYIVSFLMAIVVFVSSGIPVCAQTAVSTNSVTGEIGQVLSDTTDLKEIELLTEKIMKQSQIPGISMVIVDGDQCKYLNFGYANKAKQMKTTADTYYELGSMSKAFTALGVFLLQEEGKLSLEDPVTDYLPWLQFSYQGINVGTKVDGSIELKLRDLLYHTSGIPFDTIGYIPEGSSEDMLEKTVRNLNGTRLDFYPGEHYQYATVNYDILGLIIQTISGESFDHFLKQRVLQPLGLDNTYLFSGEASQNSSKATGYKMTFFNAREYDAPSYRGNTPAGYVISNTKDMERWMRIQMGLVDVPKQLQTAISHSHEADPKIETLWDYEYAGGWNVKKQGDEIQHEGSNPNFSSMVIMKPEKKLGVCILSNLDSNASSYLAVNSMNILCGENVYEYTTDSYLLLDMFFSFAAVSIALLGGFFFIQIILIALQIRHGKRQRTQLSKKQAIGSTLGGVLIALVNIGVYFLPKLMFQNLPWSAVGVWGSPMILTSCVLFCILCWALLAYILLLLLCPKVKGVNEDGANRKHPGNY